jgi:hypothetical protein
VGFDGTGGFLPMPLLDWLEKRLMLMLVLVLICCERKTLLFH